MQYHAPASTSEAVKLLAGSKGKTFILAGGTDLLVRMKGGYTEPDTVIDIKRIGTLKKISRAGKGWRIGAAVSAAEMGEDAALSKAWPGVVEAANLIGSTQIQGRCTMVGNLCNASPAADSVPALVAAGAQVQVAGPKGSRSVAVEDIPTGPGKTSLAKGEIIEAVNLPARPDRCSNELHLSPCETSCCRDQLIQTGDPYWGLAAAHLRNSHHTHHRTG